MRRARQLLIIDPQNDFCDLPERYRSARAASGEALASALPVAGAHADMQRLAAFVRDAAAALDAITVTLDTHHRFDIAHPTFWAAAGGAAVAPFTPITAEQVRQGRFRPRDPGSLPRALAYLDALEARGRYMLMVWPVHCEIGSWGHGIHADLAAALGQWEERRLRATEAVFKGQSPWTEHYSALQAEVPDERDPHTQLDRELIARLDDSALLLIAGEASSHCVKATTEHLVGHLPSRQFAKLVLLVDCMSPVAGFEAQHHAFFESMRSLGVRVATSDEMTRELRV
jgi:nicotinamidase-related amidase